MHPEEHKCFLLISSQQLTSLNLYVLMEKIKTMKVNPFVTTWYHSFLTSRLFGPVNQTHSLSVTWTKVSSPPPAPRDLLVLYFWTSFKRGEKKDCTSANSWNFIVKFAYDSASLILLFANNNIDVYFSEKNRFTDWCKNNLLELNANKTKEKMFDPRALCAHLPVVINEWTIEQAVSCRYFGIHLDNKPSWSVHLEAICARVQKRDYFLRLLWAFAVSPDIRSKRDKFKCRLSSSVRHVPATILFLC